MKHIREVLPEALAHMEPRVKAEHILRQHAAGIPVSEEDVDWAARIALGLTQPDRGPA